MLKENDRTELKECLTPELEKEAVAKKSTSAPSRRY
jgi:hypothetical protein